MEVYQCLSCDTVVFMPNPEKTTLRGVDLLRGCKFCWDKNVVSRPVAYEGNDDVVFEAIF